MYKRVVVLFVFLLLSPMTSCSKEATVDKPNIQDATIEDRYAQLESAILTFKGLDSGVLTMKIDNIQDYIDVNGQEESEYKTQTVNIVNFQRMGQNYEFIQILEQDEQNLPSGYKQESGIYTKYNYIAYDDGTYQWKEGAARLDKFALPEEALVYTDLVDIDMIDEIVTAKDGDFTKYTLVMDEAYFDYAMKDNEHNGYKLNECNVSYFLDQNGMLGRVTKSKKEFWIQSQTYNVEQTASYDITLSAQNEIVDMDYFDNNRTYVKPEYTDISQIWREEFINIPETYILDVRVPKVKESLPNADKINQKIALDCNLELNVTQEELISQGEWGGYPWHTTDFAVYQFGDVYEICIFNTESSAWGSGIGMWMYKYYYDINKEDEVSIEDFLVQMKYTPDEIVKIFYRDYLGGIGDGELYTYDDISSWFYFDDSGNVQFYVNLFG